MGLRKPAIRIRRCKIITIVGLDCVLKQWCVGKQLNSLQPGVARLVAGWGLAPLNSDFD